MVSETIKKSDLEQAIELRTGVTAFLQQGLQLRMSPEL